MNTPLIQFLIEDNDKIDGISLSAKTAIDKLLSKKEKDIESGKYAISLFFFRDDYQDEETGKDIEAWSFKLKGWKRKSNDWSLDGPTQTFDYNGSRFKIKKSFHHLLAGEGAKALQSNSWQEPGLEVI